MGRVHFYVDSKVGANLVSAGFFLPISPSFPPPTPKSIEHDFATHVQNTFCAIKLQTPKIWEYSTQNAFLVKPLQKMGVGGGELGLCAVLFWKARGRCSKMA